MIVLGLSNPRTSLRANLLKYKFRVRPCESRQVLATLTMAWGGRDQSVVALAEEGLVAAHFSLVGDCARRPLVLNRVEQLDSTSSLLPKAPPSDPRFVRRRRCEPGVQLPVDAD